MTVIDAVGVSKTYGSIRALTDVDLRVDAGEVVAVLGPNGAGKTTFIEIMLGMRTPDAGSVSLFGGSPERAAVRARVGAMLQDTPAPEALTVAEVVDLVRHYHPWALPTADLLVRADLSAKARARAGSLSGGQRQRLSFALAIAGDPDLLFLDEPTAALDVQARRAFWDQVRGFADLGKTVLFSTHHMDEAQWFADRVVVVDRGTIVADGPPAAITDVVASRVLRLTTDADPAWLSGWPHVRSLTREPGRSGPVGTYTVATSRPEALLADLFAAGHRVESLSVADADLEAAFLHLTRDHVTHEHGTHDHRTHDTGKEQAA